ncbi:glycosyltransferase family 4 protein [Thermosipho sp. 1070]|uniref:glycosyltransferase family 4 protein n=1 Tax=Thermosipho sp. 1070 TaxID=1437364 RepID=UPI0009493842|nr:glycosyltransferase family 4 protein [Thermosipho sp. 1070]ANQ54612.1 hypothetical protein Y592_04235 [Thermosipho sp. 1070]
MKFIVAMLGSRMHYAVPRIFQELNVLEKFYTDFYIGNKKGFEMLLSKISTIIDNEFLKKILSRKEEKIPREKVVSFDLLGIKATIARKRAVDSIKLEEVFLKYNKKFCRKVVKSGFYNASAVYGFNAASLEIFEVAKAKNIKCILEQTRYPYNFYYEILQEEKIKWPGWQDNLIIPEVGKLAARNEKEMNLADLIVCGSEYLKTGLKKLGIPEKKITVVNYGVDINRFEYHKRRLRKPKEPLKILFAGEVCLLKGVQYLLEAINSFGAEKIVAVFAGKISINKNKLRKYMKGVQFLGHVSKIEMKKLFNWADVFVFPSLSEGSATVVYEALASGLPVITTYNSGSVVENNENGFIIPAKDIDSIAKALELYYENPDLVVKHSENAFISRYKVSLDRYKNDLRKIIQYLRNM